MGPVRDMSGDFSPGRESYSLASVRDVESHLGTRRAGGRSVPSRAADALHGPCHFGLGILSVGAALIL